MKRLLLALVLLFAPVLSYAGSVTPDNAPAGLSSTIAASGTTAGGGVLVGSYSTLALQLAGAWNNGTVGQIQFEVSNDNTNWAQQSCQPASMSVASTAGASYSTVSAGMYNCNLNGVLYFRLNAVTWTPGQIASVNGRLSGMR